MLLVMLYILFERSHRKPWIEPITYIIRCFCLVIYYSVVILVWSICLFCNEKFRLGHFVESPRVKVNFMTVTNSYPNILTLIFWILLLFGGEKKEWEMWGIWCRKYYVDNKNYAYSFWFMSSYSSIKDTNIIFILCLSIVDFKLQCNWKKLVMLKSLCYQLSNLKRQCLF